MFADNSCVNGTRVDVKLFAKDVAKDAATGFPLMLAENGTVVGVCP